MTAIFNPDKGHYSKITIVLKPGTTIPRTNEYISMVHYDYSLLLDGSEYFKVIDGDDYCHYYEYDTIVSVEEGYLNDSDF